MPRPDEGDRSHHLDERQLAQMIDELRSLLDDLELGVIKDKSTPNPHRGLTAAGLIDWARAAKRDGYPTTSMREGSGRRATDDDGELLPAVSDPVGELVIAPIDPVRRAALDVRRGLTGALGDLRMAVTALGNADRPAPATGEPGCRSCARIGVWSVVHRGKSGNDTALCKWCYEWNAIHAEDPPEPILQAHADGKRITTRLVKEVMGKDGRRGKRSA